VRRDNLASQIVHRWVDCCADQYLDDCACLCHRHDVLHGHQVVSLFRHSLTEKLGFFGLLRVDRTGVDRNLAEAEEAVEDRKSCSFRNRWCFGQVFNDGTYL
jgi:hypothetical protein